MSKLIYHYTDINGVLGILGTSSLWATDINFLNDYMEYKQGIDKINNFLDDSIKKFTNEEFVSKISKNTDLALTYFYQCYKSVINDNLHKRKHYIVSFTKHRDNLRQWMSYGKPNASYCIGFERKMIEELNYDTFTGGDQTFLEELVYNLREVDYDGIINNLHYTNLIEKIGECIADTENKQLKINDLMIKTINESMFDCCSTKHNCFCNEQEIRLVFQTRTVDKHYSKLKYRSLGGIAIPYFEVPFNIAAVKEIIIGPNSNKELAKCGIENLINSKNMKDCRIQQSECSLRQF